MRRVKKNGHALRRTSYEIVVDHTVKWRGRDLGAALTRLSRQHPKAKLTIRWIPGPELLVVIQTL